MAAFHGNTYRQSQLLVGIGGQKKTPSPPMTWNLHVYLQNCRLFAFSFRLHAYPGAALQDRLAHGPPYGRKWLRKTRAVTNGRSDESTHAVGSTKILQKPRRRDVRLFLANVNSLPFVLPMEEVMKPHTLADTSRMRHRQHMHSVCSSEETAEQWRQVAWRLIAPKGLLFRQTPDGHKTGRVWQTAGPKRPRPHTWWCELPFSRSRKYANFAMRSSGVVKDLVFVAWMAKLEFLMYPPRPLRDLLSAVARTPG